MTYVYPLLLCSRINRPYYGSCPSIRLSVCPVSAPNLKKEKAQKNQNWCEHQCRRKVASFFSSGGKDSCFYPPKSGIKIGCNLLPVWGWGPPSFWLIFSLPFWASFPSREKVLLRVQFAQWKIGGEVLIYNFIKTPAYFFTGRKLRPPGIGIEATG